MKHRPDIATAVPLRRYSYGGFGVVVLGDVESRDDRDYRYIMAVVREGEQEPGMYITAERNTGVAADKGRYALRLVLPDGAQVIGVADDWKDEERFSQEALTTLATLLQLEDAEPYRIM